MEGNPLQGSDPSHPVADRAPDAAAQNDDVEPLGGADWTSAPSSAVAPWRQADRARLDRARAAGAARSGDPRQAAALAWELRRLAELHAEGSLSDDELVAAVRAALAGPSG